MTLIADLIAIPEKVHRGDFVLSLTDGVDHPRETLRDYVVTPQLKVCFDEALGFVRDAILSNRSKAAYLHGSFGSGKSHFMAVLHLILSGNAYLRGTAELEDLRAQHSMWTEGKRFLMVPYHLTGARDMESAILGQYAAYVSRLFPGVALPGFYLSEGLFEDARALRKGVGDTAFFETLNRAAAATVAASIGGNGWGQFAGGWDAETLDAAMAAPPEDPDRQRLIGDLIASHFRSYAALAAAQGEAFVPLDEGLAAMSLHAQGLGYDGVILFLDELILWLASRSADLPFVTREGVKLSKLVESQGPARPIPIVSFVARQRDLRELVGEHIAGAEQLKFADVLKYWEARFHKITLEDRNLPEIANRRVLRPRSDEAARQFNDGVASALRLRQPVLETLLAGHYTIADFRKVYPFSPALIDTLVAVSSVLQRERTALKLLMQLLVEKRHELKLGDIVPVGDLFDVILDGNDPFSEAMKIHFENARRLWQTKFVPVLEREHGVTEGAPSAAFRNDARILKTLLLAALVPEVKPLKELTPARIAALNHGTILSPIPGREAQEVLRRCQRWAGQIGEIKLTGDPNNPVISAHITGVDTAGIIANGERFDNEGNRRNKIRDMLYRELGVSGADSFFAGYSFLWRGTKQQVDICYDNVREMSDDRLKGRDEAGGWTVIIDFPFDQGTHGPMDDLERLRRFQERHEAASTLVWLPSFFSPRALEDLKKLVILDHLLAGDRFEHAAGHLSQIDRAQARELLRNQRDQLEQAMKMALEQAYGVREDMGGVVNDDLALSDHWRSLDPTFAPRPPVGAGLRGALEHLLDQLYGHLCPGHPDFRIEVRGRDLKAVLTVIEDSAGAPDGRLFVDAKLRTDIRRIAGPLKLGEMHETHFILGQHWRGHFLRRLADQSGPLTVRSMRGWIGEQMTGLQPAFENLIVLTFAAQDHRVFFLRGGPARPSLDSIPDELELRQQAMPSAEIWKQAVHRAGLLFGVAADATLSPANVARFAEDVLARARGFQPGLEAYVTALSGQAAIFAGPEGERLQTARRATTLVSALVGAASGEIADVLAKSPADGGDGAIMRLLGRAEKLAEALGRVPWALFDGLRALGDSRKEDAAAILARLKEALTLDEHVQALETALERTAADAVGLLTAPAALQSELPPSPPPAPLPAPPSSPPARSSRHRVVASGSRQGMDDRAARAVLDELREAIATAPTRRLTLTWQFEEEG